MKLIKKYSVSGHDTLHKKQMIDLEIDKPYEFVRKVKKIPLQKLADEIEYSLKNSNFQLCRSRRLTGTCFFFL